MEEKPKTVVRKIVKQGGSYVVSLPYQWIHKHGLNAGDFIGVVWSDTVVVVNPTKLL